MHDTGGEQHLLQYKVTGQVPSAEGRRLPFRESTSREDIDSTVERHCEEGLVCGDGEV